jgi:NTP pyrophosphatase (non-canonical NTP hydrolase)
VSQPAELEVEVRPGFVPNVVLCGSFHRSPADLRRIFEQLSRRFHVVSPAAIDWVDPSASFVQLAEEVGHSSAEVEIRHLAAIRNADFVWLFCPDGYVGASAAMEIGYANAAGIPVMSDHLPNDEVFRSFVTLVPEGVDAAAMRMQSDPGRALGALQQYYGRMAERRGWSSESPRDTLLLMTEEFGELARAVRHDLALARDGRDYEVSAAEELADVQLYLVHLANTLRVDLAAAVTAKEAVNARRASEAEASRLALSMEPSGPRLLARRESVG